MKHLPSTIRHHWRIQQMHVATDVLVLLPNTATYHLLGGRLPLHRVWPTRLPPKKIRVDDVTWIPHQATRSGRYHLLVPQFRTLPLLSKRDIVIDPRDLKK